MVVLTRLSQFNNKPTSLSRQYSRVHDHSVPVGVKQVVEGAVENTVELSQSALTDLNKRLDQMVRVSDAQDARFDAISAKLNQLMSVQGGDHHTSAIGEQLGVGQFSVNLGGGAPLASVHKKAGGNFSVEVNMMEVIKIAIVCYGSVKLAEYLMKKYKE